MTGKRTKRLLSLLLSVLLVAGMLPMGAMAAHSATESEYVEVKLSVGQIPEAAQTSGLAAYLMGQTANGWTVMATTKEQADKNAEMANSLFQKSEIVEVDNPKYTDGGTEPEKIDAVEVKQGDTFYLAIKLDGSKLTGSNSLGAKAVGTIPSGGMSFNIAFNDVFTPGGGYANPIIDGTVIMMPTMYRPADGGHNAAVADGYGAKYSFAASGKQNCNSSGYTTAEGLGKYTAVQLSVAGSETKSVYINRDEPWDCLVKFTVSGTATPGVYDFAYVDTSNQSVINVLTCENGKDGGVAGTDVKDITQAGSNTLSFLQTSDIHVKVKEAYCQRCGRREHDHGCGQRLLHAWCS